MHFMRKVAILLVSVLAVAGACTKKKSSNAGYSVQPGHGLDTLVAMTANINSEPWKADSVHGYKIKYATDSGKVDLMVSATRKKDGITSTLTFTITDYKGVGSYIVAPPVVSATYYRSNERGFATTGQINVDSDNEYGIIGNFNFAYDTTLSVTEGIFNVAQP